MTRRCGRAVLLLLAAGVCAAEMPPESKEFLKWYAGYQGSFYPQEVLKAYQARLAGDGAGEAEVKRRVGIITETMRAMPVEFTSLHFDKIYRAEKPPFRAEASAFLARVIEDRKPGTALDVAMGQGRNTLFLASKGWAATGYDVSEEGLRRAEAEAQKAGLRLKAVRASHAEFDYGVAQWDLVVEAFAFTDLGDAAYRKRVVDSLKPGGMLVIDGFGGGAKNQMLEWFSGLRVVAYEDRDDVADWGLQKMRVTRMAAVKE